MSDHTPSPVEASAESRRAGHEVSDADAGPLVKIGIGMAVLLFIAFVGMLVLYRTLAFVEPLYTDQGEVHPLSDSRPLYNGPRLQPDPPRQKLELREYETQKLTAYDWVDQESGIARIPVSRAIEILAETGLPARSGTGAAAPPAPTN